MLFFYYFNIVIRVFTFIVYIVLENERWGGAKWVSGAKWATFSYSSISAYLLIFYKVKS